jgi:hypothetical protein
MRLMNASLDGVMAFDGTGAASPWAHIVYPRSLEERYTIPEEVYQSHSCFDNRCPQVT